VCLLNPPVSVTTQMTTTIGQIYSEITDNNETMQYKISASGISEWIFSNGSDHHKLLHRCISFAANLPIDEYKNRITTRIFPWLLSQIGIYIDDTNKNTTTSASNITTQLPVHPHLLISDLYFLMRRCRFLLNKIYNHTSITSLDPLYGWDVYATVQTDLLMDGKMTVQNVTERLFLLADIAITNTITTNPRTGNVTTIINNDSDAHTDHVPSQASLHAILILIAHVMYMAKNQSNEEYRTLHEFSFWTMYTHATVTWLKSGVFRFFQDRNIFYHIFPTYFFDYLPTINT